MSNIRIFAAHVIGVMALIFHGSSLDAATLPDYEPWCSGSAQSLRDVAATPGGRAAILLDQVRPAIRESSPAPKRLVYVHAGANSGGTGTETEPFRSLQAAANQAEAGDKIIVRPGHYDPVLVRKSGTQDAPIVIAGVDEGHGPPIIDGAGTTVRGLIAVRGASYVTVSGFRLQNAPRDGIFVEGTDEGERAIRIYDNDVDTTGNSAIYVGGIVMRFVTDVDEYRLFDVVVEGNRITRTNEPNGRNEAISLGGGVDGFQVRNNHIFDTRQYGIDIKAGAINGIVSDNVIHGVEKHGIYLDAGSRRVADIRVVRNAVFGARNGIVLARESNRDPENPNMHGIEVVDNLVFEIDGFGILAYRHKADSGQGRFDGVIIAQNCLCDVRRDAIRLGGIRDFATGFEIRGNLIDRSGGRVWNDIGALVSDQATLTEGSICPL